MHRWKRRRRMQAIIEEFGADRSVRGPGPGPGRARAGSSRSLQSRLRHQ
jgi:hypothetical protein